MSRPTDDELYRRGAATLVASWEEYGRESVGAVLVRRPGVTIGVFPHEPERSIYNNALLDRDLTAVERAAAIEAMEDAYARAGVLRYAAWTHETDRALRHDLEGRGYREADSSLAMGMALEDLRVPRPSLDLAPVEWDEYLRVIEVAPGLLARGDHAAFHVLVARLDGASAAAAMAFDHDGDCGIYNVGTLPPARRRGLATAVTAALLHDAAARGCRTASLQSTAMAERVYAAVGFRPLGRFVEYEPAP